MINDTSPLVVRSLQSYSSFVPKPRLLGRNTVNVRLQERLSRGNVGSFVGRNAVSHTSFLGISLPGNFWRMVAAALFAMVSSMTAVVANRILFGKCKFPPLVAQPFQMLGTIIISAVFGEIAFAVQQPRPESERIWPRFAIGGTRFLKLLPLAFAFIPRILFTNESIKRTPLSTYQVLRSSAVGFSTVLTWIVFRTPPSLATCLSCCIILGGVGIASLDADVLSADALVYWVLSCTATSLYLVLLKYFLPYVDNKQAYLLNYNSFSSFWILLCYVPFTSAAEDAKRFFPGTADFDWGDPNTRLAWSYMGLSIVASFFINIAQMTLIKEASPVTADVVGVGKGSIQIVYGVVVMGDSTSIYNIAGAVMSIIGSLCYGKAKHGEHLAKLKSELDEAKRKRQSRDSILKPHLAKKE